MRLHAGPAWFRAKFSPYPASGGTAFGLMIGGTLVQGLALSGHLHFIGDGSAEDIFMGQFGAGFTYYLLPAEVYASVMIGSGSGSYELLGERFETANGVTYNAAIGKEWRVGGAWGLGPGFQFWYSDLPEGSYRAGVFALTATLH
jgi:hypothetical protein